MLLVEPFVCLCFVFGFELLAYFLVFIQRTHVSCDVRDDLSFIVFLLMTVPQRRRPCRFFLVPSSIVVPLFGCLDLHLWFYRVSRFQHVIPYLKTFIDRWNSKQNRDIPY